jgi:nitric oxide reductase NorD protein
MPAFSAGICCPAERTVAEPGVSHALQVERSCAVVASAFSDGRLKGVRLMSGARRSFGISEGRTIVNVPYPVLQADWTLRSLTCGIALQSSPSKDRIAAYATRDLLPRELRALTIAEGEVALGWAAARWPGLAPEFRRLLPTLEAADGALDAPAILARARALVASDDPLRCPDLLGQLAQTAGGPRRLMASVLRMYGQLPWSSRRTMSLTPHSVPVGGEGGIQNPNLPPPSRPEEQDPEIRADRRAGIPYPEWNAWTESFLRDHVAVLERKQAPHMQTARPMSANLRHWFEEHTHRASKSRLEDGSDLDIDRYIEHYVDTRSGAPSDGRVFRELLPAIRDVTTAVLLDGSSSLGVDHGRIFQLELACADALCHAMSLAMERHGLFIFSGNTRHRVDVLCLKDFDDRHLVVPSDLGLRAGGYTRLGAPLRHLTSRLLEQPSERRLLIVIGDGLMSDEGYEGKYAWADTAHAIEEADEAGVSVYYIAVGSVRVDPLPDVFGPKRSRRITRIDELPRVLAHVHHELVAA